MNEQQQERMELGHEPIPGYRKAFYIVLALAGAYLGIILIVTL